MCRKFNFVLLIVLVISVGYSFAGTVKLPQTGQTKCFDTNGNEIDCTGTGQDGEIRAGVLWPEPRFTVGTGIESECITDNLTGLMWPKNGNLVGQMAWNNAIDYANNLSLCGYDDWRLPNINEFESLVNADVSDMSIWLNSQFTYNVQSGNYWSSSTFPGDDCVSICAWGIQLGYVGYINKAVGSYVWPVRSEQTSSSLESGIWKTGQKISYRMGDDGDLEMGVAWPNPRFSEIGDCVTDNLTGLMWAKNANIASTSLPWKDALEYSNGLTLCNFSDWRLPNRKELRSLINYSLYNPALSTGHPFTDVQLNYYWTSSTNANELNLSWVISMWDGYVGHFYDKSYDGFSLWPVRGGQVSPTFDYYCDDDKDSYFNSSVSGSCKGVDCVPQLCQASPGSDCFDTDPAVNPGAMEVCSDGIDNDCDGQIDITDYDCIISYVVSASAGSNGSILPSGEIDINEGYDQTFTITPETGYSIENVIVDGESVGVLTSYIFSNIISDHTIQVTFAALPVWVIGASAGVDGNISPSGDVPVYDGHNQTFIISSNLGYGVADVLLDGISIGSVESYTFDNVKSHHLIEVVFTKVHIVTVSAEPNGRVSPEGQVAVHDGENSLFSIDPDNGYLIEDVFVDGQSVGAVSTFTFNNVTNDHTIHAIFKFMYDWKIETIDIIGSNGETAIAVDYSGNLHIVYRDIIKNELKYATNSGGHWEVTIIDNNGNDPDIAVSYTDGVHVCYTSDIGDLHHATNMTGSWVIQTVDGNTGNSSIAVSYPDNVHISYYDWSGRDLEYATNKSGSWIIDKVDTAGDVGTYSSISVDSSHRVYMIYFTNAAIWNNALKYASGYIDNWNIDTVYSGLKSNSFTSLDINSAGYPATTFIETDYYNNTKLLYAMNVNPLGVWAGGSADIITESVQTFHSLAVDSTDARHVSFYSDGQLKYAINLEGKWVIEVVDQRGVYSDMVVNEYVHISYMKDGNLMYATSAPPVTCNLYDANEDWIIGDFELLDAIDAWAIGILGDFDLLDLIDFWAVGCYHRDNVADKFVAGC